MDYKKEIEKRGLMQKWIAVKLGVSPPLMCLYLSGKRRMPGKLEKQLKQLLK